MSKPQITIYSDGGADPNPGAGGWGVVLISGENVKELSGGEDHTTNNRMELTAALRALEALKMPCQIDFYTDSQYLKNGITKWMVKWVAKGWRDSKGEIVQNVDLWQALEVAIQPHEITWHWVRGHTGNRYNERADQLATAARPRQKQVLDETRPLLYLKVAGPQKGGTGLCGWAARLQNGNTETYFQGKAANVTPYNMGLLAMIHLLEQTPSSLQICVEDELILKGASLWLAGWRAGGWTKPNKHVEEWQKLDQLLQGRDILWYYVKGDDLPPYYSDLTKRAKAARDS